MPQKSGNESWYYNISQEMSKNEISMAQAELQLTYRLVKQMRDEGWSHGRIQKHFQDHWAISHGAYYRRLKWIREIWALK